MGEGEMGVTAVTSATEAGACVELDVASSASSSGGLDAVYGAAVTFTDRCFVRLESPDASHIRVVMRPKPGTQLDIATLTEELRRELDDQAFRQASVQASRVASPPAEPAPNRASGEIDVDDLRSFTDGAGDPTDGEEDPLAMALRWEEKRTGGTP